MIKTAPYICVFRVAIISSLTASLGYLSLPLPSMAIGDREEIYENCAELQKHLNDNNPGLIVRGFEKVRMVRRNVDYEAYKVFCNGGIVTTRETGGIKICRGHIAYSYHRVVSDANYYASWGNTSDLPNINDTGEWRYCKWKTRT